MSECKCDICVFGKGEDYYRPQCPICKDWCGPVSKAISKKRASRTAHILATNKADEGLVDESLAKFDWEEVYALFFLQIYKHEYERNLILEREIELEESVKRHKDDPNVCSHHLENIEWMEDGFHKKVMKAVRRSYAKSKWPNDLKSY